MRPFLLADIGGTNARFTLADAGGLGTITTLATRDFDGPAACIRAFLQQSGSPPTPRAAALACAGPVDDQSVTLTNAGWYVDAGQLSADTGIETVILVNDFAAIAWAIPDLTQADLLIVGGGVARAGAPAAVLGAGTGLGMAGYVPHDGGTVIVSEGGHVTMPAATDDEAALLAALRARLGHVSAERLLCGDGLVRLYDWLNSFEPVRAPARSPAQITEAAVTGRCAVSRRALDMFCAMFGTVAGDLALTLGARGGVYIAGGIIPRIKEYFAASEFRRRFEAKGRLRSYLAEIPTAIVLHREPALVGLLRVLRDRSS